MSPVDALVIRVRAEYREMPGLSLTYEQACRLWQIEPAECRAILRTLLDEQFLLRTQTGLFIAV